MAEETDANIRPQSADSRVAAVQSKLNLPFDIRASAQALTMYLCNRGMLESIRATGSDESTWFGIGVGIFLAVAGVLAPLYITGYDKTTGYLPPFLWAVLIMSALFSIRCWQKWGQQKRQALASFNEVLQESKTVVSFPSELKND